MSRYQKRERGGKVKGRERADGGRERAERGVEGGKETQRERAMDMSCLTLRDERDGHWLTLTAQSPS